MFRNEEAGDLRQSKYQGDRENIIIAIFLSGTKCYWGD
jgi:hypothetical protein